MPVTSRDVLFILRAQDFATREIRNVSNAFRTFGKQLSDTQGTLATVRRQQSLATNALVRGEMQQIDALRLNNAEIRRSISLGNADVQASRQRIAANDVAIARHQQAANTQKRAAQEIVDAQRVLAAQEEELIRTRQAAAQSLFATGAGMAAVGATMVAAGVGMGSALGGAASTAAEFSQEIAYAATQTDNMAESMAPLAEVARRTARGFGVPMEQINTGLYEIFSTLDVGIPASEYLLQQFSKAAVAGMTDIETAGRLTMGLMNAFKVPVSQVNVLLDYQFELVRTGVGTYEEFNKALGRAVPAAVGAGQEIKTLTGMMSFMTRRTVPLRQAVTSAARAIEMVFTPKAIDNLRKLGVEVNDASGNFRQMDAIISDLVTSAGWGALKDEDLRTAIETTFGRGTIQARRFFELAVKDARGLEEAIVGMSERAAGAMDESFQLMSQQPLYRIQLLKNALHDLSLSVGTEVLNAFGGLIDVVRVLVEKFADMDPRMRRAIVLMMGFGAAGLFITGIATALAGVLLILSGAVMALGLATTKTSALMGLLKFGKLAIGAGTAAALIIAYWDDVKNALPNAWATITRAASQAWSTIARTVTGWWNAAVTGVADGLAALQRVFATAMRNVLNIVNAFAEPIYRAMRYLDPFARHSPSLVENTRDGIAAIVAHYASLSAVIPSLDAARAAVERLRDATASLTDAHSARQRAEIEALLALAGPGAIAAYGAAESAVARLEGQLTAIDAEYQRQYAILQRLQGTLDRATREYDDQVKVIRELEKQHRDLSYILTRERRTLDDINKTLEDAKRKYEEAEKSVRDIENAISDAERKMRSFAEAPLAGQREYEDQMFALEQQARHVELQMRQWEAAGAPPEALDFFRMQLDQINNQMDQLRLKREIETEPMRRDIERLVDTSQELTFDQIVKGIEEAQEEIENLRAELPAATKNLEDQAKAVEEAQDAYDKQLEIVQKYEEELEKITRLIEDEQAALAPLKDAMDAATEAVDLQRQVVEDLATAYQGVQSEIDALKQGMQDIINLAKEQKVALDEAAAGAKAKESPLDEFVGLPEAELPEYGVGLDDFSAALEDIDTKTLDDATASFDKMIEKAMGIARIVGPIAAAIGAIKLLQAAWAGLMFVLDMKIVRVLGGALAGLVGSIGLIPIAIAAAIAIIVGGFIYLWNNSEAFRQFWIDLWEGIKNAASGAWQWIQNAVSTAWSVLQGIWNTIASTASNVWNAVTGAIKSAWGTIRGIWNAIIGFIQDRIVPIFTAIFNVAESVWKGISEVIGFAWNVVKTIFNAWVDIIQGFVIPIFITIINIWRSVFQAVMIVLGDAWSFIKGVFQTIIDFIVRTLSPVWNGLKEAFILAWTAMRDGFVVIWNFIKNIFITVMSWVADKLAPVWNVLKDAVLYAWNFIKFTITNLWNDITRVLGAGITWVRGTLAGVFDVLSNVWSRAWNGLKSMISNIWGGIKNAVAAGVNGVLGFVERMLNGIIEGVNKAIRAINKLPGPDLISEIAEIRLTRMAVESAQGAGAAVQRGGIQEFDTGGIVGGPLGSKQLIIAHGGETVLPTHKRAYTGETNVTIESGAFQFNGPIDSATLPEVERMLNEFQDELISELRSR